MATQKRAEAHEMAASPTFGASMCSPATRSAGAVCAAAGPATSKQANTALVATSETRRRRITVREVLEPPEERS
jgi:hypothetical protein